MKNYTLIVTFLLILLGTAQAKYLEFEDIISELDLTQECKDFLTKTDKKLYSTLIEEQLINILDYNEIATERTPIIGLDFYHYTNFDLSKFFEVTSEESDVFIFNNNNGYREVFKFLKTRTLNGCCGNGFKAGLFIAEDPLTSTHFGKYQLKLMIQNDARVLIIHKRRHLPNNLTWEEVFQEIATSHPKIRKNCKMRKLRSVIIESSGADLISYYDRPGDPSGKLKAWFIILNSRVIENSRFDLTP